MSTSHIRDIFSIPSCGLNNTQEKELWRKLKMSIESYPFIDLFELIEDEEPFKDHCIDILQLDEETEIYN